MHHAILRYEYENAIAGLVRPSVDAVTKVLETVITPKLPDPTVGAAQLPIDAVVLQVHGVPVVVNPEQSI